ncbi:MAG: hypothetical protein ACOY4K_04260 [Pseudomonadota bacterium]
MIESQGFIATEHPVPLQPGDLYPAAILHPTPQAARRAFRKHGSFPLKVYRVLRLDAEEVRILEHIPRRMTSGKTVSGFGVRMSAFGCASFGGLSILCAVGQAPGVITGLFSVIAIAYALDLALGWLRL